MLYLYLSNFEILTLLGFQQTKSAYLELVSEILQNHDGSPGSAKFTVNPNIHQVYVLYHG